MENIFHRIKAYLYKNLLTENRNDFIARVIADRTLNIRQICELSFARGGADISVAAMEHAVNLWLKEMAYQLCDGFAVNAGWFTVSVHIKGVFNSPDEKFDPERHTLVFEFHQGAQLRQETVNIKVDILGVADTDGHIGQVTDVKTGSVNDLLTPGRNLKISGYKIKVFGDNPSVGLRFRNTDTDVVTPVDPSEIVVNYPTELIIVTPDLEKGTYMLEDVTQFTQGSMLKNPVTIVFDSILTVL